MVELKGVMPAVTTPFKEDGSLDLPGFRKLIDTVIEDGAHNILINGCAGEAWALDTDERTAIFEAAVDQAAGRVPIVAGCGAIFAKEAIANVRQAERGGCDVAMIQPPWYVLPNEEEIFDYYKEIFGASDMPVMVYNIPRRTNINLSVDLVDRLADERNVIALKESSKDWLVLSAMIRRLRDRINVLTGFAPVLGLAALSAGAVGYVCSATPVLGPSSRQFYDAVVAGDLETARRLDTAMTNLTPSFQTIGTWPAGIKVALDLLGRPGGWPRPPIKPLNAEQRQRIREALVEANLLSD